MRIRWKFFITLIAFSVIPLLVVTIIAHQSIQEIGRSISLGAKKKLAEIASSELKQSAENYATVTKEHSRSLQLALYALAEQAQRVLAEGPKNTPTVYFASDFDTPESAPPELRASLAHLQAQPGSPKLAVPVSYQHQVFWLPPGMNPSQLGTEIAQLAELLPVFQTLFNKLGDSACWLYVSLENGVHTAFPGHGGYPADYDPQDRPWYVRAKELNAMLWTTPLIDPSTGQLIMTVSTPLHSPDGKFAGVAAIDVLVTSALQAGKFSLSWSADARSFLVKPVTEAGQNQTRLLILAQQDYPEETRYWAARIKHEYLASSDTDRFTELCSAILSGKSSYMELPYKGAEAMWAFAQLGTSSHIVLIVPKQVVMAPAEKASDNILAFTTSIWRVTATTSVLLVFAVALVAFAGARSSTRPVQILVDAWRRLANGDFSVRLNIRSNDERDLVYQAFNTMVPRLEEHVRIRKALELAQKVQQNLLPQHNPQLSGFDIAGTSVYCDETGGDYYDFFDIHTRQGNKLAIVVGDVSGHGVSSALLMATARALMRLRASMPGGPAEVITDVNCHLSRDTENSGDFMTAFYAEIDADSKTLQWVRAGHDPAIVYDREQGVFKEIKGDGPALGMMDGFKYQSSQHILKGGEIIVIGTDGIWEMHNEAGIMFGKDALREIIRNNATSGAGEIIAATARALREFRGEQHTEDDVTMVVIKVFE